MIVTVEKMGARAVMTYFMEQYPSLSHCGLERCFLTTCFGLDHDASRQRFFRFCRVLQMALNSPRLHHLVRYMYPGICTCNPQLDLQLSHTVPVYQIYHLSYRRVAVH